MTTFLPKKSQQKYIRDSCEYKTNHKNDFKKHISTIKHMATTKYNKNTYRDENIYKYRHFLFFRDVPCRDLFLSKCLPPDPCQNRICMDHSVEEVFQKAQELLE